MLQKRLYTLSQITQMSLKIDYLDLTSWQANLYCRTYLSIVLWSKQPAFWPTPSGIEEKDALKICQDALDFSKSASSCRKTLSNDLNIERDLEFCVSDIQVSLLRSVSRQWR